MQWVVLQSNKNSTVEKFPVSDLMLIEIGGSQILKTGNLLCCNCH